MKSFIESTEIENTGKLQGNEKMRYIGILIMAGTLSITGFAAAEWRKEQLCVLQKLRQMIYHLKNRMLYINEPLPEAMKHVGERFETDEGRFFVETGERLKIEQGRNFADIWKEEAEKMFEQVPVSQRDRENLLALGKQVGYADRSMQERILLFYLEQTDESIAGLKDQMETKVRLFRCLGVTAGLFLLILLV